MRRGGFRDAGGVVASAGELPIAKPVPVFSEEQLRCEFEGVAGSLKPSVDWVQRVVALVRLESLVLGGATHIAGFTEGLQVLRDPLIAQVLERRSAVSRQACHVVTVLAEACGERLEPLALPLLQALLKAIAMGIQVVTDAADACARALVRHCHTPKLLPRLCSMVTADKNGKLRQCASSYLLQAFEEWDSALLDRHLEAIEAAILAAAQDAQSDTRASGRQMYAIYGSTWPARAAGLLQRAQKDRPLQEKLQQALEAYRPGVLARQTSNTSHEANSLRSSLGHASASGSTQPNTPRGSRSGGLPGLAAPSTTAPAGAPGPRPAVTVGRPPPLVPRLALGSLAASGGSSPTTSSGMPNSARQLAVPSSGITPRAVRQPPQTARAPRLGLLQEGENQRPNSAGSGASTPRSMQGKPGAFSKVPAATVEAGMTHQGASRRGRQSMGGAALRINIAALTQDQASEDATQEQLGVHFAGGLPPQAGHLSARRVAPTSGHPPLSARARRQSALPLHNSLQGPQQLHARPDVPLARRVEADRSSACDLSDSPDADTTSELAPSSSFDDRQTSSAALPQLLAQISKPGTSWVDKVQLYGLLAEGLQGPGSSPTPDVAANADRVAVCLLDGIGDAHFKIATAALEALAVGLSGCNSKLFEPYLDRLMPALFLRTVDAKEQVKQLAATSLAEVPRHHAPDAVLAALAKALQQARAPKVKTAVLDFFSAAATGLVDLEDQLELAPGPALRMLVGALLRLVVDKNHDIRRTAVRAASVIYMAGQGSPVVSALQALPPAEAAAVQRVLAPVVPTLEADLAAALRASRPAPVQGVGAAAAPTAASSRRSSGEGLQKLPELPLVLLNARGGPIAAPKPVPGSGLSSPRSLSSPRGPSPVRRLGSESPAAHSPSLSRLGRQASNLSYGATEPVDVQLARQPSSCVTHTSSPVASQPVSRTASWKLEEVSNTGVQPASPLGGGSSSLSLQHSSGPDCASTAPVPVSHQQQEADQAFRGAAPHVMASVNQGSEGRQLHQPSGSGPAAEQATAPHDGQPPGSTVGSMRDLAPFDEIMEGQLRRLLAQLAAGPSPEAFQGLSRLAHVLPGSVWHPHFSQVLSAILASLGSSNPLLREGGLMLVQHLAGVQPELFVGPLPALLPRLLESMADASREVVVAADEALEQLLGGLPPLPSLDLLAQRLPQQGAPLTADPHEGGLLYGALKNLNRVVQRLGVDDANQAFIPGLLPGLCLAYCSPIADVRKATVDCLVSLWLLTGDGLLPHLNQLSPSQMKLLTIYKEKAVSKRP